MKTDKLNIYIQSQREFYERKLYKEITQYCMIAVERKVKANTKIKESLEKECNKKYDEELKKDEHLQNFTFMGQYVKEIKKVKTNWNDLENVLKMKVAKEILHSLDYPFYQDIKLKAKELNLNFNDANLSLSSKSKLDAMVDRNLSWIKRHYNSMRMIKSFKKKYNKKYYQEVRRIRDNRNTRDAANKISGANKTFNTMEMVLEQASLLRDQNIKITIDSVHKQINDNGLKLGKTQIAKYLKTLRTEGQL